MDGQNGSNPSNPSEESRQPDPQESIRLLAEGVAKSLAESEAFLSSMASRVAALSVQAVAESAERERKRQQAAMERHVASLEEQSAAAGSGGDGGKPPVQVGEGRSNEQWRDAMMTAILNFLNDPIGAVDKVVGVVQKIRAPTLDTSAFQRFSVTDIINLQKAKPNEFAFVAQQVTPDPMTELIPQLTADAYRRGFGSIVEAQRWARELLRTQASAERLSTGSSSSGTRTESSTPATKLFRPASGEPPAQQREQPPAIAVAQNRKKAKKLVDLL